MFHSLLRRSLAGFVAGLLPALSLAAAPGPEYSTVLRQGMVYDGSGARPFVGDVAWQGDRIVYVGPQAPGKGAIEFDARGKAIAPGFVNMLAHPFESLLIDGRALSDLRQGITLEVFGELSMGPLNEPMKADFARQMDPSVKLDWTSLGEYFEKLVARGITPNVASFVSAGTVRVHELGEDNIKPNAQQLEQMRLRVREAMEQGALGLTSALIYAPYSFASTEELSTLASESARCGGMYIVHMRSEADRLFEAVDETIRIARESGAPAEIYHLKIAGRDNWHKLDGVIERVEAARRDGTRITANMYLYPAGATGLDAAMPLWVQEGGYAKWAERLKDPAVRERVAREMNAPARDWENLYQAAGPEGMLLLAFKNPALRPYIGKTLAEVAKLRGTSPAETAMQLVIEDGTRVGVAYFLMSEDNIRRQVQLPWMSFGSDAAAPAPEGVFLQQSEHPRAYGNFARLLARYVRDEKLLPLEEAVRRLTSFPVENLNIPERGRLKNGYFADIVVFDPAKVQDHATFQNPHQLSTGVTDVWVNGARALADSEATRSTSGRFVRGRAYRGPEGGGCRASSKDWTWRP
ncbi:MAG: N-acyl-D-amino-acid deacylase family protein [Gammaproteobacteria bacterium]